ncbi:cobyrinate a,c-diamide synthase [Shimia ponticola]|uniref:cobyrinate a,c-diamide synthase n=1 Tax=Shimia ponticola TaxID=2582893 RepID=UPI0011BD75C3|nr:cobyrinate a,c-diamide synthase [Shimia ponticola]
MKAILIAAPQSGSGKTTVTLGLLRALAKSGADIRSVKLGPDYIDPTFHAAATGQPALNLDPWAMSPTLQHAVLSGASPLVIESAMGLFDGAGQSGKASAAEVAKAHDIPVLLVIDCARQSHSVAAMVHGFTRFDPDIRFHGLILNNVGSERHEVMLRNALSAQNVPIRAVLRRDKTLAQPSRHLGLVQASEREDLPIWLDRLADWLSNAADPTDLLADWQPPSERRIHINPPAQNIAIAQDIAFSFMYPHLVRAWQNAGARIEHFSPLRDDAVPECDLVFLPGGYPELHAGRLASNEVFLKSLRNASEHTDIYGECGGYMALGDGIEDSHGDRHQMAGLLRLETSFARPTRHLGYRRLSASSGPMAGNWTGHEFHHSNTLSSIGDPLFAAEDADGTTLAPMGLRRDRVYGSYAHVIAPLDENNRQA